MGHLSVCTVESPNNGHFGTQASVLYSGYVPYWGVVVKPPPTNVLIIVCCHHNHISMLIT